MENEVWAYIAHKNGYWAGVAAPDLNDIGRWVGKFIRDGFSVSSVKNRDEYNVMLNELKPWHEFDEWKAKHSKKRKTK